MLDRTIKSSNRICFQRKHQLSSNSFKTTFHAGYNLPCSMQFHCDKVRVTRCSSKLLLPLILGKPNFPKSANLGHFFVCRQKPIGLTKNGAPIWIQLKKSFSAICFSTSTAAWAKSCLFLRLDFNPLL